MCSLRMHLADFRVESRRRDTYSSRVGLITVGATAGSGAITQQIRSPSRVML